MSALPPVQAGTSTFLFTDIEGSTRLLRALGDRYPAVLEQHRELIAGAIEAAGGRVFGTEGDALFSAFPTAGAALSAAAQAQRALAAHEWPADGTLRVRMGVHSGEATQAGNNFVGLALHEVARAVPDANDNLAALADLGLSCPGTSLALEEF